MKYLIILLLLSACAVGGERVDDYRNYVYIPPDELAETEEYYW